MVECVPQGEMLSRDLLPKQYSQANVVLRTSTQTIFPGHCCPENPSNNILRFLHIVLVNKELLNCLSCSSDVLRIRDAQSIWTQR